jgi:hypothetical protein
MQRVCTGSKALTAGKVAPVFHPIDQCRSNLNRSGQSTPSGQGCGDVELTGMYLAGPSTRTRPDAVPPHASCVETLVLESSLQRRWPCR